MLWIDASFVFEVTLVDYLVKLLPKQGDDDNNVFTILLRIRVYKSDHSKIANILLLAITK